MLSTMTGAPVALTFLLSAAVSEALNYTLVLHKGHGGLLASKALLSRLLHDVSKDIVHDCGGCPCRETCFAGGHCPKVAHCKNGGIMERKDLYHFICECPRYYVGQCCQTKLCLGGSRLINGSCVCTHPELQYGQHCEKARCLNGGRLPHEGYCRYCPWPWSGPFCEKLICLHGGHVEVVNGTQACVCKDSRYYGSSCETVKELDSKPRRECLFIFEGDTCEYFGQTTMIAMLIVLASMVLLLFVFAYNMWVVRHHDGKLLFWATAACNAHRQHSHSSQPMLKKQNNGERV